MTKNTTKPYTQLPYPMAAVVRFVTDESEDRFLIDSINMDGGIPDYAVLGHKELNTQYMGSAWHDHDELELVRAPDLETWRWLNEAKNDGDGPSDATDDFDDGDDDENEDEDEDEEPKTKMKTKTMMTPGEEK